MTPAHPRDGTDALHAVGHREQHRAPARVAGDEEQRDDGCEQGTERHQGEPRLELRRGVGVARHRGLQAEETYRR